MIEREKVIKGLEYHLKELTVGKTCYGCPYCGDNPCEIQLIANAIALLKEQEPRVLTIEEVLACNPRDEWLWFEEDAYGYIEESAMICAQIYGFVDSSIAVNVPSQTHDETIEFDNENYGKTWRCWSAKPTDEQRRDVKWDD